MDGQPVEPRDYRDIVQVADPQLSPDGETVAFVRKDPDGDEEYETTVYTVPVDGGEPRQFTAAEGDDSQPRWSPDGDRLAFASARGDADEPQVRVLPADGGESRRVTNVPGGVSDLSWSPDGSKLAFVQSATAEEREAGHDREVDEDYEREQPDPRVIDRMIYRAMEEYFDGERSHVYVVDLETESVERVTDGDYDFVSPAWGDASTLYYAVKRGSEPDDSVEFDLDAYDLESGTAETVTTTTAWEPSLAATTDGRVAYTFTPDEKLSMRQTEVEVYDREADETVALTAGLDRTVFAYAAEMGLAWGPDEEHVYFVTPDEGDFPLRRARAAGEAAPGAPDAPETPEPEIVVESGTLSGFSVGAEAVAFARSEWDHRGDVFVRADGETRRLTNVNADYLADRAVGKPEAFRFDSDGHEIQGWVLTPPDFGADEQYPLVVEIHGGPHAMWSTSGTMWHEFQALAAAGYVVFWCNPRGSTGYGEAFAMAIERDWGDVTMTDVVAGAESVMERDYVDEENAFVTGGSFGGYMTAWVVGHTDRFAAAVTQRGVYEFSSFYGSTDAFKLVEGDFGTVPWEEPAFLWEQSPTAYAPEVDTPTLVMHSENDFRAPVNNAEMLYLFLRKNGVATRFVRYPREGHELSRSGEPAHVVDRLERVVRWFDGYSDHHDAPPALERAPADGLSPAASGGPDEDEDEPDGDDVTGRDGT